MPKLTSDLSWQDVAGSFMAVASFQDLCAGFCEIVRIPVPALKPDDQGRIGCHVRLRGATVNLVHCPHTSPDHVFVIFEFGPLPAGDAAAARAMRFLLDANHLLLEPDVPVFSRNGDTGDVFLQYVYALFEATPSGLYELIDEGIELAALWRKEVASSELPAEGSEPAPRGSSLAMLNLA